MKSVKVQAVPAPPSLMGSLRAGFDATANHLELLLIPVVLDLFLWLGLHLRLDKLIEGFIAEINRQPTMSAPETMDLLQFSEQFWSLLAQRLNLFSALRSYPVGTPSLMAASQPITTPFGTPPAWQVPSFSMAIGLWLIFTLAGLLMGSIYFTLISQVILSGKLSFSEVLGSIPWSAFQVFKLALYFVAFLVTITLPLSCLASLLIVTGLPIGQISLLIFLGLVAWLLLPFFFSPHGIFILHIPALASVRESFRLIRATLPRTALFFLIVLAIDEGLTTLWMIPEGDSWLTFISVVGHAFVVTGLVAASFVYYRDTNRWLQKLIQQAQLSSRI